MEVSVSNGEARIAIINNLDKLGIKYVIISHNPVMTMEAADGVTKMLDVEPVKCLLLHDRQKNFYLVMMPGNKRLATSWLTTEIGSSRLSFAADNEIARLIYAMPGCVNPLGLMFDRENHVKLVIDKSVLELSCLGCHPCDNRFSVKLKMSDLIAIFLPSIHHEDFIVVDMAR